MSKTLEDRLEEWFDDNATVEPDGSLTLVLPDIYGWEDKCKPELKKLFKSEMSM